MRLGFAVKVMARPDLPSNDARRWQNSPHLRVSLQYLAAIFDYLEQAGIHMYRISSDLAPYLTRTLTRADTTNDFKIEVHPEPEKSIKDGAQSLSPDEFSILMEDLRRVATVLGRSLSSTESCAR